MNKRIRYFLSMLMLVLMATQTFAQQQNNTYYDYARPWAIGIHGGASWNQSDINPRLGWGLGLDLGKRMVGSQGSFFAVDWRGRLTYTRTFGQGSTLVNPLQVATNPAYNGAYNPAIDYTDTAGVGMFHNFRNDMLSLNLELPITFNKLRERTGWVVQLFPGIGLGVYNTGTDQINTTGELYDYASINTIQSNGRIKRDIIGLRDRTYLDDPEGFENGGLRATFSGQLGLGVGYQFNPRWSAGIEHRAIFNMSDRIDGLEQSSNFDTKHLTNLYLRYHFGEDDRVAPIITITSPETCPYTTRQSSITLLADILHVDRRGDISCTVNGITNNTFSYNTSTDKFAVTLILQEGNNEVTIRAKNEVGSDVESCVIIYNPPITSGVPPRVTFQRPNRNPENTRDNTYRLVAKVEGVTKKGDIALRIDGRLFNNFNYNNRNKQLTANIRLQEGSNVCEITATNNFGRDVQSTVIIKEEQIVVPPPPSQLPQVIITQPQPSPYNTQNRTEVVRATVRNVANKNDITVKVNGTTTRSFNYNATRQEVATEIELREGSTVVTVEAVNRAGRASDAVTIIRDIPVDLPTVTITQPNGNPYNTTRSSETVRARLTSVKSKNNVIVQVNGVATRNFSYNPNTGVLVTEAALRRGNNTVRVEGRNDAGQAFDVITIVYEREVQPQLPPVITINIPRANPYTSKSNKANINARITNIDSKQNVTFIVNGQNSTNFNYNPGSDIFTTSINLIEGNNTFEIYAANSAGNDQYTGTIVYRKIVIPTLPPIVNITVPSANPYDTKKEVEKVKAKIQNITNKSNVTFKVNGRATNNFSYNNSTKMLDAQVSLIKGANIVEVEATNESGNDRKSVTIIYRPEEPVSPPVVTILNPTQNMGVTNQGTQLVQASIQNIDRKNQITFRVNGTINNNFSFNATTKAFSSNVSLVSGANKFEITATNNAGTDKDEVTIMYRLANASLPIITFTNPSQNNTTTNQNSQLIQATIKHVQAKNQITFRVNGKVNNNFSFNANTKQFSSNVGNLVSGANNFEITATNIVGTDKESITVVYQVQGSAPVITMRTPSSNPYTTNQTRITVKAGITNLTNSNGITFKVNGTGKRFTYNPVSQEFSSLATLKQGNNTFELSASNNFGNSKVGGTIIYNAPVQKPVIEILAPRNNPHTTSNPNEKLRVRVKNVKSKQDVNIRIDGQDFKNFSYNSISGDLNINYTWKPGVNVVSIKATNSSGIDTKVVRINYARPQPPVVKLVKPARNAITTSNATEKITATITNITHKNDVSFLVNGRNVRTFNFSRNSFTATVNLKNGNNTFEIGAATPHGQDKVNFSITRQSAQKPVIQIITPNKNPYTSTQREEITAKVLYINGKNDIRVKVNGQSSNRWRFNASTKVMNIDHAWNEGANTATITATNAAGSTTKTQTMIYKPVTRPSITITKPTKDINTTRSTEQVRATITGVQSNRDIRLKINGKGTTAFSFDRESGAFSANINLQNGSNTVSITATNAGGTKSASRTITYNEPVSKPSIQLINPNGTTHTTGSKNITLRMKLNEIKDKSQITFTVNGAKTTSYSFNGSTKQFSANVSLKNGANSILIAVQNKAGADYKSITITYQPSVTNPPNNNNNRRGNNRSFGSNNKSKSTTTTSTKPSVTTKAKTNSRSRTTKPTTTPKETETTTPSKGSSRRGN